jgi:hypothetical protein
MTASIFKFYNKNHYISNHTQAVRSKMLKKTNELGTLPRVAVALPTAIASWGLMFSKSTVVKLADVVAEPILKSTNKVGHADGSKYSHGSKVKSWVFMLPKLALKTPGIALRAAIIAAIAPFYILGKTVAIMAGHGKSSRDKFDNFVDRKIREAEKAEAQSQAQLEQYRPNPLDYDNPL